MTRANGAGKKRVEAVPDSPSDGVRSTRSSVLDVAREVFQVQQQALAAVAEQIDERFAEVCEVVLASSGRVVTLGMGKSGLVARKIAATLSSTGTPSFFVHPADAIHGDLGKLQTGDVALMVSASGETEELLKLIPHLAAREIAVIAVVAQPSSSLAQNARVVLNAAVPRDACPPLSLAPTSSATAASVMGDALAVALARLRGFGPEEYKRLHPGGAIGRLDIEK